MAKQMRICDQDLIINKVVKSVEQVRREAYEENIKSQPEWKEFLADTTKYQKEYDRIDKLKSELNVARKNLEERIKDFNEQQGFTGYNEGICQDSYLRDRPDIRINTNGLDWEIRQEITEEVRFAGMSGDFDAKQMIEDLVAKFS
jgi:polyribonucleotide nucleotidyltransferase